jgi:hypothetical protein
VWAVVAIIFKVGKSFASGSETFEKVPADVIPTL